MKRIKTWKYPVISGVLLIVILTLIVVKPWREKPLPGAILRVEPDQGSGFYWPFYLHIPDHLFSEMNKMKVHILVRPANTGKVSDDFRVQEASVLRKMKQYVPKISELRVACLFPVFPRPESNPYLYTHALDRDVLTTDDSTLARLDRQLVFMIDVAIDSMEARGFQVPHKVLLDGFSASGMFANRFTVLHPERVAAAAIGSPGGWPIAPVEQHRGKPLRYPVGSADYTKLAGYPFDRAAFQKIPHYFYIGRQDSNDSVPFADGYEQEDADLIFDLFGSTPVERWTAAESIYQEIGASAEFRVYEGVGHKETPEMRRDINKFFLRTILSG